MPIGMTLSSGANSNGITESQLGRWIYFTGLTDTLDELLHSETNPTGGGFLCLQRHSKVCFELLKILRTAQNALSLQEIGLPPKSEILSNLRRHLYSFEWSELFFTHSFANSVSLYFCFG